MVELLDSKEIHSIESRMIALLDRTFLKSTKLDSVDYKKELPKNVKRWFGSKTFEIQLDNLITELIKFSLLYADGQMKILTAAKVEEGTILTKEAIARATDISENAAKSIIKMLEDDAIYYEGPAKLGRRIEDLWQGQRSKAVSFAHTFSADVATGTTVYRYRQYGVQFMEFSAKRDDRTTEQCVCLDKTVFDLSKQSVDAYRPPLHHRCRSALLPIPNTREPQKNMIFENRDFSGTLDDPDAVEKVFKDIEKFNDKYRVSGFVIDQDLSTRIMLDKGAYVSIVSDIPVSQLVTKEVVEDVVTNTAFVPAKTVKEAEEWAKANSPIKYIDYNGLDIRVANDMNERLMFYTQNYPEVVKRLNFYGTAQAEVEIQYKLRVEATIAKLKAKGKSKKYINDWIENNLFKENVDIESAYYNGNAVAVNLMNRDYDKYIQNLIECSKEGFSAEGCGSLKAILDHEFGHAIDATYSIRYSDEMQSYLKTITNDEVEKTLSLYAATMQRELIAEAWTSYLNTPVPGKIASDISRIMLDAIEKGVVVIE